jgi:hypothetical protein
VIGKVLNGKARQRVRVRAGSRVARRQGRSKAAANKAKGASKGRVESGEKEARPKQGCFKQGKGCEQRQRRECCKQGKGQGMGRAGCFKVEAKDAKR